MGVDVLGGWGLRGGFGIDVANQAWERITTTRKRQGGDC
jgi:hypothetical protein